MLLACLFAVVQMHFARFIYKTKPDHNATSIFVGHFNLFAVQMLFARLNGENMQSTRYVACK